MQEERTKDLSSMREQFSKDALLVPNKEQEKKKQKKKSNLKILTQRFTKRIQIKTIEQCSC